MRHLRFSGLIVVGGAAILAMAQPARADDTLSWSFASGHVQSCTVGSDCAASPAALAEVARRASYGPGTNAAAAISSADYAAVTGGKNYGGTFASAGPGEGDGLALPTLHAYASGLIAGGPPATYGWNFASAQGVQGFRNDGESALVIPIGAFVGYADFTNTGAGTGIVSAALALTTSAIEDEAIGRQWFNYNSAPGFVGQFAATCGTTGAIALGNPGQVQTVGPTGAGSITVAPTSCLDGGADSFTLNPGESFYLWARLSTFRAAAGATDASNTFTVGFSPDLAPDTQRALIANLVHVPGVGISAAPEPASWALLILGFGGVGAMVRRRRGSALGA